MFGNLVKLVSVILMCGLQFTSAMASDNNALMTFARQNAQKFKSELVELKGITLDSKITVQGTVDKIEFMYFRAKYRPEDGEMVIGSEVATHTHLKIFESCKTTGSFVGQNAYGAKTTVRRQKCERFFAQDGNPVAVRIGGSRIKMTPSQFRAMNSGGVKAEFDLIVGHPNEDIVVRYDESIDSATVRYPTESHMKVWSVYGRVEEIRWVLPGEAQAIQIWRRQ